MAHTKAGGTAKNLRDSRSQRLGVKLFGGQAVRTGMIIIRQRGTKYHPGIGTKQGKDDTIYAMKDGVVRFLARKLRKYTGRLKHTMIVSVEGKSDSTLRSGESKTVSAASN